LTLPILLNTKLYRSLQSAISNYCGHPAVPEQIAREDYSCDCDKILTDVWTTLMTHIGTTPESQDAERPCVRVWRFYDAPDAYRRLSTHGGDEDWVAWVPPSMATIWIPWLTADAFVACDVSEYYLPDGAKIVIGSHA
jgi:hypothetical protein